METQVKLTTLTIPGNLFLAPIAGFTDRAFRSICIRYGADFTFTEMVSAEGIVRNNPKTLMLLRRADNEKLLGIQIFSSSAKTAGESVKKVMDFKPDLIDLNCGCPVSKIVRTGSGAALLLEPAKIKEIVKAIKVETDRPVSVKIRSGWDSEHINYLETAKMAVEGGAEMITLHPRTRSQGYSGRANWEHLKELKKNLPVPVIGSGDLFTTEDAIRMFEETDCNGIMFARGAIGNPPVFRQTKRLLQRGTASFPKNNTEDCRSFLKEKLEIARDHLNLSIKYRGASLAVKEMKKHICAYTKGLPNSSNLRAKIAKADSVETLNQILRDYYSTI